MEKYVQVNAELDSYEQISLMKTENVSCSR